MLDDQFDSNIGSYRCGAGISVELCDEFDVWSRYNQEITQGVYSIEYTCLDDEPLYTSSVDGEEVPALSDEVRY